MPLARGRTGEPGRKSRPDTGGVSFCLLIVLAILCPVDADGVVHEVPRGSTGRAAGLRQEQHRVKGVVKLAVIAPADPHHEQSLSRILPAVSLAIRAVISPKGPLPGWNITVDHRDSRCSSTYGPIAAFDFYITRTAGQSIVFDSYISFFFFFSWHDRTKEN